MPIPNKGSTILSNILAIELMPLIVFMERVRNYFKDCRLEYTLWKYDGFKRHFFPFKYQSAYEIIGPVMVGPSSSHTAEAVRIGNIAHQLLNEKPLYVRFSLMGSFAETYQGHGTDLALIAGVMGLSTMDDCCRNLFSDIRDRLDLNVVDKFYFYLGLACGNIANILNPNTIVIGGGVSAAGEMLINGVQEYFNKFAFPQVRTITKIKLVQLRNDAGVIGAASLDKHS
jgi:hypothetical protein